MITGMNEGHLEAQYPANAREKEISEILKFATRGQSCQLISVPGAGRSTTLRLLTYNPNIQQHHLGKNAEQYLFVYVNFAEIPSFDTQELHKFLFLSLLTAAEEKKSIQEKLYQLFAQSLKIADSLVLFENLKKAMFLLTENDLAPVFIFDRFSEFGQKTGDTFFANLRTLKQAQSKLAIVFSTHRPLEEFLPIEQWKNFYEFFINNHVFLSLYDGPATELRLQLLEREYQNQLNEVTKKELISLTGGHGKLMKLSAQLLLDEKTPIELSKLSSFLLSHILIKGSLFEIWEALTSEEKRALKENKQLPLLNNLHIPFPLFEDFVEQNIADLLVPKTIRLSETNEIYFGDEPLTDLTSSEFRLLSFLITNPNRVCERDEVIQAVWKDNKTAQGVSDEAIDQMIYRLRRKVEDDANNPQHILTVKGRGFRFLP